MRMPPNKEVLFRSSIAPSLNTFVSYRFEDISRAYFLRLSLGRKRKDIIRIGIYRYDDRVGKKSGEFDVALYLEDGTCEIYECRFLKEKATESLIREEKAKVDSATLIGVGRVGLISSSGFECKEYGDVILISGEDIYFI